METNVGLPKLERFYESEDGEKHLKKSIITGKSDGALYMTFENIETKERPIIQEIDLSTGEAILIKKINVNKPDNGMTIFKNIEFEFITLDLSKYHIIFNARPE